MLALGVLAQDTRLYYAGDVPLVFVERGRLFHGNGLEAWQVPNDEHGVFTSRRNEVRTNLCACLSDNYRLDEIFQVPDLFP